MTDAVVVEKVDRLTKDVGEVKNTLSSMAKSFVQLVKLDSNIKQQDIKIEAHERRINDHENRMRVIETGQTVNNTKLSFSGHAVYLILTVGCSIAASVVTYMVKT